MLADIVVFVVDTPGTGKTSLIKALAQYTGRSIVSIPLTRISTNSELTDLFFQDRYNVTNESVPIKLGFKDVIYVMEDVDAASKIVRRRDGGTGTEATEPLDLSESVPPKTIWSMLLESNDSTCQELVQMLIEKSERLREAALESDVLTSIARRIAGVSELCGDNILDDGDRELIETVNSTIEACEAMDRFMGRHACVIKSVLESGAEVDDAFIDELLGLSMVASEFRPVRRAVTSVNPSVADPDDCFIMKMSPNKENGVVDSKPTAGPSVWSKPKKDELNLMGLLNVLDGVVDTPGRILIMTTNHPELLDPALIRPGRIDKRILLAYMSGPDAIGMIEHYFQSTLTEPQKESVVTIFDDRLNMTPAELEQMSAEHDDLVQMLNSLEARAGIISSPSVATITAASSFASTVCATKHIACIHG